MSGRPFGSTVRSLCHEASCCGGAPDFRSVGLRSRALSQSVMHPVGPSTSGFSLFLSAKLKLIIFTHGARPICNSIKAKGGPAQEKAPILNEKNAFAFDELRPTGPSLKDQSVGLGECS